MNSILHAHTFPSGHTLELVQGDITTEQVDAIVNAANSQLAHGGGVAAIIANKGGPVINEESRAWVQQHGPVSHTQPAYTSAGDLPCKYVIHAVGPVWGDGDEDAKLSAAVKGSLSKADELELKSIAFPAISTGIFGFPKARAARVIYQAIGDYFAKNGSSGVKQVRITLFDQETTDVFTEIWQESFSTSS
ncbi:MAG: macro domain-containing protein [Chloroflexi bacterium]|nr:MAG: macro domain-containing protein [Chloroflexota bacterium]MBL1196999.1 macro domain-containing protein [Chloroflexota bacterium]NOH14294.1 macro domain-containing protein [Chloroflexota bacterium]